MPSFLGVASLFSALVLKFNRNEFLDVEQSAIAFSIFMFDSLNPPLTGCSLAHRFVGGAQGRICWVVQHRDFSSHPTLHGLGGG